MKHVVLITRHGFTLIAQHIMKHKSLTLESILPWYIKKMVLVFWSSQSVILDNSQQAFYHQVI